MAGSQEKTEKPTSKRLTEARKRGNVPKSREFTVLATCLGGGLAIYGSAGWSFEHLRGLFHSLWGNGFHAATEGGVQSGLLVLVAQHYFAMVGPVMAAIFISAVATQLMQVQGIFSWEVIKPKFSKLNPLQGLRQLVSPRAAVELVKSLLKVSFVTWIVYLALKKDQLLLFSLIGTPIPEILRATGHLLLRVLIHSCLAMLLLSLLDYGYQRWQYHRDLRMTKQELKDEHKQGEGNPQVKARMRSIQRALARQRMMSKVPQADVVITNPTHYAVALVYTREMEAPRVIAKGQDRLAQRIVRLAREHAIAIVENAPLARALYQQVDLEETIPVTLYRAVAKILAYVYQQREWSASRLQERSKAPS
jgi:flagellar biosynthetic protein FlhB